MGTASVSDFNLPRGDSPSAHVVPAVRYLQCVPIGGTRNRIRRIWHGHDVRAAAGGDSLLLRLHPGRDIPPFEGLRRR
jgi:hypothetical protein